MWWIFGGLLLIGLFFNFLAARKSYQRKQMIVNQMFESIEDKFVLILNNYFLKSSEKAPSVQQEDFVEEAFKIIKPEVDAIFDTINQSFLVNFKALYPSKYFKEAVLKVENLCKQQIRTKKPLTEQDLNQIHVVFKDCLRAKYLENKIIWNLSK
jgi:2-polyprenyl-3-methyl-5-hydroxy-6-metoxy-1,4-benzoquinol methylase